MPSPSIDILKNHRNYYRSFPWREDISAYRIMIAEFMLHRTRAEQVVRVYRDFLLKFPSIQLLSRGRARDIQTVTRHLGLHWRGEHFKKAARFVLTEYGGVFPEDRRLLREIPGVGDYVAGAILTVCYNKPEYVVDSNIARFINRYFDLRLSGEIRRKRTIIIKARELFDIKESGNFLFALLDFTALICKPLNPDCNNCVLLRKCAYKAKTLQISSTKRKFSKPRLVTKP